MMQHLGALVGTSWTQDVLQFGVDPGSARSSEAVLIV